MIEQRSDEWFAARCGKVTASRVADAVAKTKNGWGASRANYMAELVAERLTGTVVQGFTNAAMQWGTETEPEAIKAFEFYTDLEVTPEGFVDHPRIPMSGASPDGLIGDDGLIEVKCPNTATHIDTLLGTQIADKYIKQMQWQMACTDRQWCVFASYDPRLPESLKLYRKTVERDEELISQLEADIQTFISELDEKVAALTKLQEVA